MQAVLPRLRFPEEAVAVPASGFAAVPEAVWLEVGFGGGEHAPRPGRRQPGHRPHCMRRLRERYLLDAVRAGAG